MHRFWWLTIVVAASVTALGWYSVFWDLEMRNHMELRVLWGLLEAVGTPLIIIFGLMAGDAVKQEMSDETLRES